MTALTDTIVLADPGFDVTLTDMFCGAGGSSTGAALVPGVRIRHAANHWPLAVETHNTNHPEADHSCADLSQVDPRYFPTTTLAWLSPSCTKHSRARGVAKDTLQGSLFDEKLPDEAAERSRATMWDVVRFAEYHQYEAVIVENVVEVADWLPFRSWLLAMDAIGYHHQIVSLNSMHAQAQGMPAAQSRDRLYIVFWKKGNRRPDLAGMQRPPAYCPTCDKVVSTIQSWKKPNHNSVGRYRTQYVYRCPSVTCRNQILEPAWLPATAIIDWSLKGQRIGDRTKPMAEKTRKRIAAGIARYWQPIHLEAAGNTYDATDPKHVGYGDPNSYYRAWPTTDPFKSMHTTASKALAIPPQPFIAELRGGGSTARSAADPLATVTASGNHHALIQSYYGATSSASSVLEALPTVTTVDRHALVMRNNTGGAEMVTPAGEPVRTITTAGHQSILTPGDLAAAEAQVDDVLFRMLAPHEVKGAMAFPDQYVILGNKREQVKMCGNAVTPPAARDLVAAVVASLRGEAA